MSRIDDQRVVAVYQECKTQAETARRLGLSQSGVSAALRRAGIRIGKGSNQPRPDHQRVLDLWDKYHNQHTVAQEMSIPQATVSHILIRHGIRVGKGNREPAHKLPMDEVAARYLAGESTLDLGTAYGVDPEVIRRRLRSAKVARRSLQDSRARGPKNSQYKHGKGYNPMHYYRRQSYEVAAICLGRPVPQGWVIHHLDENPHNNQPDNLILFPSQNQHAQYHQQLLKHQRAGEQVSAIHLALGNGGQRLPQPPAPIEF